MNQKGDLICCPARLECLLQDSSRPSTMAMRLMFPTSQVCHHRPNLIDDCIETCMMIRKSLSAKGEKMAYNPPLWRPYIFYTISIKKEVSFCLSSSLFSPPSTHSNNKRLYHSLTKPFLANQLLWRFKSSIGNIMKDGIDYSQKA